MFVCSAEMYEDVVLFPWSDVKRIIPYVSHSLLLSTVSPVYNIYQLKKLYQLKLSFSQMAGGSLSLLPAQTILRIGQLSMASKLKKDLDPWCAFAGIGVMQGIVYGHANLFFARHLRLCRHPLHPLLVTRGSAFGAARDTISQGVPFMFHSDVKKCVFDPLWPSEDQRVSRVKEGLAVVCTSGASTLASHFLHVCQTTMQCNPTLSYQSVWSSAFRAHGWAMCWNGAAGRMALLLVTNLLNYHFLTPIWTATDE